MTKDVKCHIIELVSFMAWAIDFVCDTYGISGFC